MQTPIIILFGFSTSHQTGHLAGHMSTTQVRFFDTTGKFARLIEKINRAHNASNLAFKKWVASTGLRHRFWGFELRGQKEREKRLTRRMVRKIQSLLRAKSQSATKPTGVEVTGHTDSEFRPLRWFQMEEVADNLDSAQHPWFSIEAPKT